MCTAITNRPTLLRDCNELFATSSYSDVRVWHASTGKELLRLSTPNITCHAVTFTPDGKAIITGIQLNYYIYSHNVLLH